MAVELVKSTAVTNADTTPPIATSMRIHGARLKERVGKAELSATASIASIARLCRIASSDRISRVLLSCDAITLAAADIGLYDIAAVNSGAVVDVDFFASAQSLATALSNTDASTEADPTGDGTSFGIADLEKTVWEALGLTADPGKLYDVALTLTAAATGAGTVALKVVYVDGN